jgi:predicted permease
MRPAAGAWPAAAAPNAVVISDELWRLLGAPAEIPGAHVTVDHRELTIAAIAPPSFRGLHLDRTFDVWIPLGAADAPRGDRHFAVIGRLTPAASVDRLQRSLDALGAQLAREYPATNLGTMRRPNEARRFTAVAYSRLDPSIRRELPLFAAGLFLATGLLLLSACVNAGSLLLSRGLARRVEMTIKVALGADRRRLVRECLFEAVILAFAGSVAGILAAAWTSRGIPALFAPEHASLLDTHLNRLVVVLELMAGALAGVGFGLLPALAATRALSPELLRGDVSRINDGRRGVRLRMGLAGAQLGLSTMFLIAWTVMGRVTSAVLTEAEPSHLQGALILASVESHDSSFLRNATSTLLANPSVALVGWVATPPLGRAARREFRLDSGAISERFDCDVNFASTDYFRGSYTPILDGRFITHQEELDGSAVVVNEAFALRYFAQRAVGQTLTDASGRSTRIVGVVKARSYRALGGPPDPMVYYPISLDTARDMFAAVRFRPFTTDAESETLDALRRAGASRVEVIRFEQHISRALASDRLITALAAGCGLLALALSVIGIASVMADGARRRAREMGIRAALGAQPVDLTRALLGSSLMPAFGGLAVGTAGAVVASRGAQALVYGVPSVDGASVGAILLIVSAVVAASVLPAVLRAIRASPLHSLKEL